MIALGALRLGDGRRVDFAVWGRPDAASVLYCHGTPGSRLELLLAEAALERSGSALRIVALNRPGYGRSTGALETGHRAWARVAAESADLLGLDRFAVLGASGGSPFALACALELGPRVTRIGIVAGAAPPDVGGMEEAAALTAESTSATVRRLRYGSLALGVRFGLAGPLARRIIDRLGPADRRAMNAPSARDAFARIVTEAFAQRGRATAHESGLLQRPWTFEPAAVSQPVRLWHGEDDTRIPAQVAPALARRIPHADAVLWPRAGHFSWALGDEVAAVTAFLAGEPRTS